LPLDCLFFQESFTVYPAQSHPHFDKSEIGVWRQLFSPFPKTAQTALRQSNVAFILNQYPQTDNEELVAAQNMMLDAIFNPETGVVQ
jgi:hypothetical protein